MALSTFDIDLSESPDVDDLEGAETLTTPLKNYRYKGKEQENESDEKLQEFIARYKLQKLSRLLIREGITTEFLISQNEDQIKEIAAELTSKTIQRNKVCLSIQYISNRTAFVCIVAVYLCC